VVNAGFRLRFLLHRLRPLSVQMTDGTPQSLAVPTALTSTTNVLWVRLADSTWNGSRQVYRLRSIGGEGRKQ